MSEVKDFEMSQKQLDEKPSAIYRPELSMDGNQWCALYGKNLHHGIAGFGDTPELAMEDFDKNWRSFNLKDKLNATEVK